MVMAAVGVSLPRDRRGRSGLGSVWQALNARTWELLAAAREQSSAPAACNFCQTAASCQPCSRRWHVIRRAEAQLLGQELSRHPSAQDEKDADRTSWQSSHLRPEWSARAGDNRRRLDPLP